MRTYVRYTRMGRSIRCVSGAAPRVGASSPRCVPTRRARSSARRLVREAEDDDDWRDAGCRSNVEWFMQLYACDYRSAQRIVRASEALRELPALDHALGSGELTLDQAVAVAEVATPETDAELARVAVGKAPGEISRTRAHDRAAALSPMTRRSTASAAAHDLDARKPRAQVQRFSAARARRRVRAGDLGHRQAAARRRQEARQRGARMEPVLRRCARHARHPAQRRRRLASGAARRR